MLKYLAVLLLTVQCYGQEGLAKVIKEDSTSWVRGMTFRTDFTLPISPMTLPSPRVATPKTYAEYKQYCMTPDTVHGFLISKKRVDNCYRTKKDLEPCFMECSSKSKIKILYFVPDYSVVVKDKVFVLAEDDAVGCPNFEPYTFIKKKETSLDGFMEYLNAPR